MSPINTTVSLAFFLLTLPFAAFANSVDDRVDYNNIRPRSFFEQRYSNFAPFHSSHHRSKKFFFTNDRHFDAYNEDEEDEYYDDENYDFDDWEDDEDYGDWDDFDDWDFDEDDYEDEDYDFEQERDEILQELEEELEELDELDKKDRENITKLINELKGIEDEDRFWDLLDIIDEELEDCEGDHEYGDWDDDWDDFDDWDFDDDDFDALGDDWEPLDLIGGNFSREVPIHDEVLGYYDEDDDWGDEFDWLEEDFSMSPDECLPGEKFDARHEMCFLECDSLEECDELERELQHHLDEEYGDYFDEDEDWLDDFDHSHLDDDLGRTITTYVIQGDTLGTPDHASVPPRLRKHQEDTSIHETIWKKIVALIPADERKDLTKLIFFTDGHDGNGGYVNPNEDDPTTWMMGIDVIDAARDLKHDPQEITNLILHEYAHILTLRKGQVTMDPLLVTDADDDAFYDRLDEQEANCKTYFVGDGCSHKQSYINQFVDKFWKDLLPQHERLQEQYGDEYFDESDAFYRKHRSQFVTEYASTSPEEDIAEAWLAFVLKSKPFDSAQGRPQGNSVAEQKVLFFYNYPELVELRDVLRRRL